ncbi:MAG: hypothetical protein ACRED0_05625 [Gammaproteobacteria bacterium]
MDLHRIGIKCFFREGAAIPLPEFIPILHRWIQTAALDDLLIDVADYSHVHAGPGILLVAHEGNYCIDETGGRRGLVYYSKRSVDGDLATRLQTLCKKLLKACALLEQEPELQGRVQFLGNELQIFANDRLTAPNSQETLAALAPALGKLLAALYLDNEYSLSRETDPQERFAVTAKSPTPVTVKALLQRLKARGVPDAEAITAAKHL